MGAYNQNQKPKSNINQKLRFGIIVSWFLRIIIVGGILILGFQIIQVVFVGCKQPKKEPQKQVINNKGELKVATYTEINCSSIITSGDDNSNTVINVEVFDNFGKKFSLNKDDIFCIGTDCKTIGQIIGHSNYDIFLKSINAYDITVKIKK